MSRNATIDRSTKETKVKLTLELDGRGEHQIETGVPFFDHMLTQIARHGFFDLTLAAAGDLEIDAVVGIRAEAVIEGTGAVAHPYPRHIRLKHDGALTGQGHVLHPHSILD